jgi:Lrp/AsnC family transcriptional regulator for asnA, asnC and gidA
VENSTNDKNKTDRVDAKIIELLQQNGRMPNTEISKILKISETTVRKRLKKLIDEQFIQVIAVCNLLKLDNQVSGNIKLKVDPTKTSSIIEELNKLDGLWYIAHMTGVFDFDLEFQLESQNDLGSLIESINQIDGVLSLETSFLLQQIKNRYDWGSPK